MATYDIGFLVGNASFNEFVGVSAPQDIYRFGLDSVGQLTVELTNLSDNADLYLYFDRNNNGLAELNELITGSANLGLANEGISGLLGAGVYLAQVTNVFTSNTNYTLSLSNQTTGIQDLAGNTVNTALNIGFLGSPPVLFNEFVGQADTRDLYRFDLGAAADFSGLLYQLSQNANLRLFGDDDNNGILDEDELILASTNSGVAEDKINIPLPAGRYYVLVDNGSDLFNGGSDTNYLLSLAAPLPFSVLVNDVNQLNLFKSMSARAAVGGARNQHLDLTFGDDLIQQLSPNSLAQDLGGVRSFDGNDTVGGSVNDDVIYGNVGMDLLVGNGGNDMLLGGRDNDQLFGKDGNDFLNGNLGNDVLNGEGGDDLLRGNRDNDVLSGGDGNDVLIGDFGNDTLIGGSGRDTFAFRTETEAGKKDIAVADQVSDFVVGEDRIGVVGSLLLSDLVFGAAGPNTVIQVGPTGDILAVVFNVSPSDVANSTFIGPVTDSILTL
ncbi:MAG TPA: calcium-binding protein [Halomicronema sp.]